MLTISEKQTVKKALIKALEILERDEELVPKKKKLTHADRCAKFSQYHPKIKSPTRNRA